MNIRDLIQQRQDDLAACKSRIADLKDQVDREQTLKSKIQAEIDDLTGYLTWKQQNPA